MVIDEQSAEPCDTSMQLDAGTVRWNPSLASLRPPYHKLFLLLRRGWAPELIEKDLGLTAKDITHIVQKCLLSYGIDEADKSAEMELEVLC